MGFICPVCGNNLIESEKSLACAAGHLFDKSKKGYVNLLLGRDGSVHGDSKPMALSRYAVMESGLFEPLKDSMLSSLKAVVSAPVVIADCGCGECYYTAALQETFPLAEVLATDISKEALAVANRRDKRPKRAVASSFSLPIANGYCDAAINLFSPFVREEYLRILKPGGILYMAIPLEKHLWELKATVYEKPYENAPKDTAVEGFRLLSQKRIEYHKTVAQPLLMQLFGMTPYAIKTSPADIKKLEQINYLKTNFSFLELIYQKEC